MHHYALAITISLLTAPAVFAKHHKADGDSERIVKKLDLNEQQKKDWKQIRQAAKPELEKLRKAAQASREALKKAMETGASDAELKTAHQKMQSAQQALAGKRFETMLKTRQILTPEQRQKFRQIRGERKHHRS